jgi:hypothetical protein
MSYDTHGHYVKEPLRPPEDFTLADAEEAICMLQVAEAAVNRADNRFATSGRQNPLRENELHEAKKMLKYANDVLESIKQKCGKKSGGRRYKSKRHKRTSKRHKRTSKRHKK